MKRQATITTIIRAFKKMGYIKITNGMFQRDDKNGVVLRTACVDNNIITFYAKDINVDVPLVLGKMPVSEFIELAA